MLKTFFDFDCTDDKKLFYPGTKRPEFLNVGLYSFKVIEKLLDLRIRESVDTTYIEDDLKSRKDSAVATFTRGGVK